MTSDTDNKVAIITRIRKQASEGDAVCAEYLALIAHNNIEGGGLAFIETLMDMEEDDEDFRPY